MTGTSDAPHAGKLSIVKAIGHALVSADIDFYPRVQTDDGIKTLKTQAMLAEMGLASADWHRLDGENLETAIKLARQSLDEVKQQTEYQDQKATRLLTMTTFLTALSGALFARFNDSYPLRSRRLPKLAAPHVGRPGLCGVRALPACESACNVDPRGVG